MAGGVALQAMLGWSEVIGILIGFVLVVAYCYAVVFEPPFGRTPPNRA